jgi:hypothetical protein
MVAKAATNERIDIPLLRQEHARVVVVGQSPLILNAMSSKVKHDLLAPTGRKTAVQKASSMKHDPLKEFRESAVHARGDDAATEILFKAVAFKKAMMGAALDIPGAKKAQIGRLVYIEQDWVDIYGTPELYMDVTRSADMARTPDIRTRAILPMWCAAFDISFVVPTLNRTVISNLLTSAGITQGVGDFRVEKGAGNYGRFRLAEPDDEMVRLLMENSGREAQVVAFENPEFYDEESRELFNWHEAEARRRGFKEVA